MAITVQLSNYRYVDIVIAPFDGFDDDECVIKINKETLAAVLNEEVVIVEQRCFMLYTKQPYTVTVKRNKERYYHHSGSNVEELLWFISYSSAVFEINTVYVYINSNKHVIEVYIPDDAVITRNDHA